MDDEQWDDFQPAAFRIRYSPPLNGRLALHAQTFLWCKERFGSLMGHEINEIDLYELLLKHEPSVLERIGLPTSVAGLLELQAGGARDDER